MEIKGSKVLVLGGYGQVGIAICRLLLINEPKELIVTSLKESEVQSAIDELSNDCRPTTKIKAISGNLFLRWDMKEKTLAEISKHQELLEKVVDDNMDEMNEEILTSSMLYRVITENQPDIIVDCITTAGAMAYRNVYSCYEGIRHDVKAAKDTENHPNPIHNLLITMAIPPLIRHIQILHEAMKCARVSLYLKVGTTGTGGMGLNLPFTHGEESPSRLLMTKAAIAGAHSMLLFLLHNMPGGPIIKEIKPAAMIGWKRIDRGVIKKSGQPVKVFDCKLERAHRLILGDTFRYGDFDIGYSRSEEYLQGTYVDTGENGLFSLPEFKILTALGLMEFVTPEEIACSAIQLIRGTGGSKNVLEALDGAVMGPTYRAGFMRESVVRRMESLGPNGISYGLLGPKISKLVFEAQLLRNTFQTIDNFLSTTAPEAANALKMILDNDQNLRIAPLSIGIPILLPDGEHLLFASRGSGEKEWEKRPWEITRDNIHKWASFEWIDLRPENIQRWRERVQSILNERMSSTGDSCSRPDRGETFWQSDEKGNTIIDPGEFTAWILINEFGGGRPEAYRESCEHEP
jgi:hypothetical protein